MLLSETDGDILAPMLAFQGISVNMAVFPLRLLFILFLNGPFGGILRSVEKKAKVDSSLCNL